jgi:hypothetical protein
LTASGNTITAEKNFWGHGSGPDTSAISVGDPNPHGAAAQGEAAVGQMTVIPWYGSFGTTPTTEFVVTDHSSIIAYSAAIQGGVDAALDGDTITIAGGTYLEQVTVEKNLTIHSAGAGSTILTSPSSLETCWSNHRAVLCIRNTNNVVLDGLAVDGDGQGNGNELFVGIGVYNTSGDMDLSINDNMINGFDYGIVVFQSTNNTGNVVLNQNCITESVSYGLYSNTAAITVDAANNYWGSVFGPYHPTLNPSGTAAPVTDGVDFRPWLSDCGGFPVHGIQILVMVFR